MFKKIITSVVFAVSVASANAFVVDWEGTKKLAIEEATKKEINTIKKFVLKEQDTYLKDSRGAKWKFDKMLRITVMEDGKENATFYCRLYANARNSYGGFTGWKEIIVSYSAAEKAIGDGEVCNLFYNVVAEARQRDKK